MSFNSVLNPHGTISKALAELHSEDGPDLDIPALAEEARVSVQGLCQLDQGQLASFSLGELESICRILGRSPNDLLGYEADLQVTPASSV